MLVDKPAGGQDLAKWEAWNAEKGKSQDAAKEEYIKHVEGLKK